MVFWEAVMEDELFRCSPPYAARIVRDVDLVRSRCKIHAA